MKERVKAGISYGFLFSLLGGVIIIIIDEITNHRTFLSNHLNGVFGGLLIVLPVANLAGIAVSEKFKYDVEGVRIKSLLFGYVFNIIGMVISLVLLFGVQNIVPASMEGFVIFPIAIVLLISSNVLTYIGYHLGSKKWKKHD